jgi:hypothetical protein
MLHAKPCAHDKYRMTCEEFDHLQALVKDRCQICGTSGPETPHGALHIDHDAGVGEWAVRGLLCSRCNTQLDSNAHLLDSESVAQYLDKPWYAAKLAELGLPSGSMPGPPVGSTVTTTTGCTWHHSERGWLRSAAGGTQQKTTWRAIERGHGPHRLRVRLVDGQGPLEAAAAGTETYKRLEAEMKAAKEQRDQAIRQADRSGYAQTDIVKATGLTRETIRRITNPEAAAAVRNAQRSTQKEVR